MPPVPPARPASKAGVGLLLGVLALLLVAGMAPVRAQQFPQLTGRVVDTADLLSPAAEAALTQKLEAFETASSDQVVVATVPDLQGYAVEDYANRLARQWALGQAKEDNGVLLLVARDDRKVRIEVGYGLEGTLTDALSRTIIDGDILPAFRGGDFAGGIARGVDGILAVLSGNAAELKARAERNRQWSGDEMPSWLFFTIFAAVFLFVAGTFVLTQMARLRGRRVGPNRYRWLGTTWVLGGGYPGSRGSSGGGFSGGGSFSGGGGSFGGGGASGSW
ncbi:YgcG family protein [Aurantimonas sp. CSK15Z-1]|nr:YgcG family protein [Aurantimonas sp. CSK15Z-1]